MASQGNCVTFVKKQTVARNLKLKKKNLFFGLVGLSKYDKILPFLY